MFHALARFSVRFRWIIVVIWVLAIPVVLRTLPALSSVVQSDNTQFLPADSLSQQAAQLAAPFEGANPSSTAIIVAARTSGPLTPADDETIAQVEQAAARVFGGPLVAHQGTSKDGQARSALVVAPGATATPTDEQTLVDQIRATFPSASVAPGLTFHLTGALAQAVDATQATTTTQNMAGRFSLLLIIVLLLIVFRSVLAPIITLLPAALSFLLAGPLIAQASKVGLPVSSVSQTLLVVLVLGAGTDYGLFLVFRMREELSRGLAPRDAVVQALGRVGESITYSAATVIVALLSLLLASFGVYRRLGPALAIGLALTLLAALTLLPALLAIVGRAAFWPVRVQAGGTTIGWWGRIAEQVVRRPVVTLLLAVVVFGLPMLGLIGYQTAGVTLSNAPVGSDSALGMNMLTTHFPAASTNPEDLLLQFNTPIWSDLQVLAQAQQQLGAAPVFRAVSGPLNPNGIPLTTTQLAQLHTELGPPGALPATPPVGIHVSPQVYQLYRAESQFISADGDTVEFRAVLNAGAGGTPAAQQAIPQVRTTLESVARKVGAQTSGVVGQDAALYDVSAIATSDVIHLVPVVLAIIAVLLALLLRSLVAPWYLIITIGCSYLAALGIAMIVFVHLGGDSGLNFVLPFLMFIFSMALGEDYNILVMSRIREEAHREKALRPAVTRAIGITGGTVTSAGIILAGTFAVLGASGTGQIRQIGFGIAAGIVLDTFFVRTLLVPSIVVLLDRWNWWPSRLWRQPSALSEHASTIPAPGAPTDQTGLVLRKERP